MKVKVLMYVGLLGIGLLLGWVLFGGTSIKEETAHDHDTATETGQMWTCSMHPQIMQPEPGDCPICGMDLIPAEVDADGLTADQFKLTKNAMALANIQTSIIGGEMIEDGIIKLSGKIVENEKSNAVQVSYFSGRIESLHISFTGEEVRQGQLLATVYSPELYAAQQELITTMSLKASQPTLYKAVRNKLKLWKLSEAQINQIEQTGKITENFPVYATVSGTVTEKLVEQGDYIKQGQPLLKIANLNTVWANFDVYENQIDLFKKGQEVSVKTNSYPDKEFKGTVDFIDPILNTKTRTVKLRVVLNNTNDVFKPGMFVEGHIHGNILGDEQLIVPSSAVLWTGERSVVYIKPDPSQSVFEIRKIKLGSQIGDTYQVLEGLKSGDEIVTNGTFTVDAAAQLQGKKSMMNNITGNVMTGHEGHHGMGSTTSVKNEGSSNMNNERINVSKSFQNQLKTVFNNYVELKDALIKDDSKSALDAAKILLKNLSLVDMKLLSDNKAYDQWLSIENKIKKAAVSISETSDIKVQRNHFKHLSFHLISAVQLVGVDEKVYVEFCPMADNNNGGYWLSKEEKVANPYFGGAMLTCGEVNQIIE